MPDLRELLKHQGIESVGEFLKKYPDQFSEHENVTRALAEHFGQKDRISSFLSKADQFGGDDLDFGDDFDDLDSDVDGYGSESDGWDSYNTNW